MIQITQGKVFGKGLTYIEDLNETWSTESIVNLDMEQFNMLCSFCNENELDKILTKMQGCCNEVKAGYVLKVMGG